MTESLSKLEFMFMKHSAPNRCEPSIEALNLNFGGGGGAVGFGGGVGWGLVRVVVNRDVKFL